MKNQWEKKKKKKKKQKCDIVCVCMCVNYNYHLPYITQNIPENTENTRKPGKQLDRGRNNTNNNQIRNFIDFDVVIIIAVANQEHC